MIQILMITKILGMYLKKVPSLIWVIIVFIGIGGFAVYINSSSILYNFITSCTPGDATNEISSWFNFITCFTAFIAACIAWVKVGAFHKQNEERLFLFIDERWGSSEVLEARKIIHTLYRKVQDEYKSKLKQLPERSECFRSSKDTLAIQDIVRKLYQQYLDKIDELEEKDWSKIKTKDNFIQAILAIKILELSFSSKKVSDFILLLNFLDFMDTIGYLAKDKDSEFIQELDDLCGHSIIFHYKVFEPYMVYKNHKHELRKDSNSNDIKFYHNFKTLYDCLNKNN